MKYSLKLVACLFVFAIMAEFAIADEIVFWTIEEQPDRLAVQEAIAEDFKAATGHTVKVVPVTETDLHTRISAAFAAGALPDVVTNTVQHLLPWSEAGILDISAATEVVEDMGADQFAEGLLGMATIDGEYVSTPHNGSVQFLVYRKDLFEANGLEAPTSFEKMIKAMNKLNNPPEMYGFVAPTKVDENYMMQIVEHLCLANDYSPIADDGRVNKDKKKIKEVLELYKAMVESSPKGELFWKQSRELYLAGKAAMIMWSGALLDELGGLRDSAPVTINDDPTSTELAKNSGFVTAIAGPSNPNGSAIGFCQYFGITTDANTDVAIAFVKFMLDNGYIKYLSMNPENKLPVLNGKLGDWSNLDVGVDRKESLSSIYPEEVINSLIEGLEYGRRWGADNGQLAKSSDVINSKVLSQVFRKYADGELTLDEAADEVIEKIEELM